MIKTLILFLLPLLLTAQRYTVLDTAYTTNVGGTWFDVREVTYSTGEWTTSQTLIGDTTAYFNASLERFQDEAKRMSVVAQQAFNMGKRLGDMKKERDKILTATGRDILDTIAARNFALFADSGWKVRDTTSLDVDFTINANGQLRYLITGFQTRNADLFGDALILNNFKSTGSDLFLFRTESQNYRNRDGTVLLRKPGGAQNRAAEMPEAPKKTEPIEKPTEPKKTAKKKKNK